MKTIEQTRREFFEVAMEAINKSPGEWRGNHYSNPYGNSAWQGFNAALDAVAIELPSPLTAPPYASYEAGWNDMRDEATDSIESLNLGLKIR